MSDIHRPERKLALTVRLTESQYRDLRKLARAADRSISATARALISNGLADVAAKERAQ